MSAMKSGLNNVKKTTPPADNGAVDESEDKKYCPVVGRWHLIACICGLLLAVAPGSVRAHGEAPAPLNALVDHDGRLVAIHTNIGLAIPRNDGGFHYYCPILWGEEDLTPLPWLDGQSRLVEDGLPPA